MSEAKKIRDVALKKYQLEMKGLTRFVTQKNSAVVEKTIEKVEKVWTEFRDAEAEYLVELENDGKQSEAEQLEGEMDDLKNTKDEAIRKAQILASNTGEINNNSQENVGSRISNTIQQIEVSKTKFEKYQVTLSERRVEKWKEEATVEVFRGVELDKYTTFLDKFQKSTGFDEQTRQDFEILHLADEVDRKKKIFYVKKTSTSGKYGMYVAVKIPGEVRDV